MKRSAMNFETYWTLVTYARNFRPQRPGFPELRVTND